MKNSNYIVSLLFISEKDVFVRHENAEASKEEEQHTSMSHFIFFTLHHKSE